MTEKLICRPVRPYFSDALDGVRLPLLPRFAVFAHLTFCPRCRRMYKSLEETRDALKSLKDTDPVDGG